MIALVALVLSALPVLALAGPSDAAAPAAGSSLWTKSAQKPQASLNGHQRSVNPSSYKAYTLDKASMAGLLATAPLEDTAAASRGGATTVSVPAPTGELIDFAVVESPIMESELAAAHPEITTYAGSSTTDGFEGTIRLDQGPLGFHASVISGQKSWYVDPAYIGDTSLYLSYFGDALPAREKPLVEPQLDEKTQQAIERAAAPGVGEGPDGLVNRREYRLALVTDPSYAAYFGASAVDEATSNTLVLAAKTTLMNRVNQIYNDDLAVKMLLVNGSDKLNFQTLTEATGTNGPCGASACYSATDMTGCGNVIDTNTNVVGLLIGAENYDIGHIAFGPAGDGGGVAYLGQVGLSTMKAGGCTGLNPPTGDFFAIDYVAHEMGHQFGGNHTFNGTQGSCGGGNRNAGTSVEPGSGSSVMAYAGICAQSDLQPHTDPYFSQRSQTEITAHVTGAVTSFNEIQRFGLANFGGTDGFTLDFGGTQTATITNGTNYTTGGVKAAIEAVTGATATVASLSTGGFQVTYSGALASTNIVNPTIVPTVAGSFTWAGGDYVKGGTNTRGGTATATGNHNPTVTAPAAKSIPIRTPFTLTGSATDTDGNTLTYLWEQNNTAAAGTSLIAATKLTGPLFRVFGKYANVSDTDTVLYNSAGENLATTSPSRTFPDMAQVLAGSTNAASGSCPASSATTALPDGPTLECHSEFLPTALYTPVSMTFRLTARDQVATGGGTQFADTVLTIDKLAGPLLASSQATNVSYAGNSSQTVTWAVNSTDKVGLAPNVKISLSTDGGQTFPNVLAASTPNDGTESVTIPNIATTQARIKIEAVDNYFFDVNDANFTITAGGVVGVVVTQPTNPTQSVQYSDPIASVGFSATTDRPAGVLAASVDPATPLPAGLSLSARSGTDAAASWTVTGTTTAAPGAYPVTVKVTDGTQTTDVPLTFTVTQETATPTYTGDTSKATAPGASSVDVDLAATVTEQADGTLGDLANATATFVDTATATTLCTSPVTSGGAAGCTYSAAAPGTYQVKVNISGRYTGTTASDTTLTVTATPAPTGVTVTPPASSTIPVQYSDAIPTVSFSATTDRPAGVLAASIAAGTPLPNGLSLSARSGTDAAASWTITGTADVAPGSYPVTVKITDGTQTVDMPLTFTVTAETATATYTGPTSVPTAPGAGTVDVPLTATVAQQADGSLGDLTTATATFKDTATSTTLCTDPSVTAGGVASCTYTAAPGTYQVKVDVGGRFTGTTAADTALTVTATPAGSAPDTTITGKPSKWLLGTSASFVFGSTVGGSTFACSLDGAAAAACTSPKAVTGLSRATHVFTVAATAGGQTDPTPARAVTTVPVDDTALKAKVGKWKRKKSAGAYLGTYTKTKTKGAVLSYKVTNARSFALVVTTGKNNGKVKVYLNGVFLKKVKLKGPAQKRKVVDLGTLLSPTSGELTIVTKNKKLVRIEGLGVATTL